MSYTRKQFQKKWITDNADEAMIVFAEDFAKWLANYPNVKDGNNQDSETGKTIVPLTSSQLRKFFAAVKRQQLSSFNEVNVVLLKPKLAYAVGRSEQKENGKLKPKDYEKKSKILRIEDFNEIIQTAIDAVLQGTDEKDKAKRLHNFINFFEAIVAYQKVYGKDKDKQ